MFCGMPIGGAASAFVTQALPPGFDWRALFYIGGVLPLLLLPAIILLMQETWRPAAAERQLVSMPMWQALFGEGRATITMLLWAMLLPAMLDLYLILNWLPTLFAAKGFDRSIAPLASLWFNLAGVVGGLTIAPLVDRIGYRWPVSLAFVGLLASLVFLAEANSITSILVLSGSAGFFLLGASYAFYSVAAACYATEIRGTGAGAAIAIGRIGSVIGPLLAGSLMSKGLSADTIILYMAPFAAMAGVAVLLLGLVKRESV
jgi:AAHS family 3-hydroxyphenylpropionic acid transporter